MLDKERCGPSVSGQMIREYIYAYSYSALAPATGDCFSMIAPQCNTESMSHFLKLLTGHYSDYRIALLHLPPYSPELNLVELLWREIRRKHFHNKIFNSLDEVEDTLNNALASYHVNAEDIIRLSKGYSF